MKAECLNVNGTAYQVKVFYENRKNSTASIRKTGVIIRIPCFLGRDERFREIMGMKLWAKQKILENPERLKPAPQREYKDGDALKVGNEDYVLKIEFKNKKSSSARIEGSAIYLSISSNLPKEAQNKHISALLSRCVAGKRLPTLQKRVGELNNKHFNQKIGEISFKHQKSRWGSCSKKGNINISTRLLFAPDDVLEYVCLHELAHLIEHNHSERFWSLVEKALPNYKEKERWLKENGDGCGF